MLLVLQAPLAKALGDREPLARALVDKEPLVRAKLKPKAVTSQPSWLALHHKAEPWEVPTWALAREEELSLQEPLSLMKPSRSLTLASALQVWTPIYSRGISSQTSAASERHLGASVI